MIRLLITVIRLAVTWGVTVVLTLRMEVDVVDAYVAVG
jgi:hypothetical protein